MGAVTRFKCLVGSFSCLPLSRLLSAIRSCLLACLFTSFFFLRILSFFISSYPVYFIFLCLLYFHPIFTISHFFFFFLIFIPDYLPFFLILSLFLHCVSFVLLFFVYFFIYFSFSESFTFFPYSYTCSLTFFYVVNYFYIVFSCSIFLYCTFSFIYFFVSSYFFRNFSFLLFFPQPIIIFALCLADLLLFSFSFILYLFGYRILTIPYLFTFVTSHSFGVIFIS